MSSRAAKRVSELVHVHLAVRVDQFDCSVEYSINRDAYAPQYALDADEDDPVHEFTNSLTITGFCTDPKERAGDVYELTFLGDNASSKHHNAKLKDIQQHDHSGRPRYRQYRGREIPVYDPPKGLGVLDKVRGEKQWKAWISVPTQPVTAMFLLLSHGPSLFVGIHERRENRTSWIQSLALQTRDPAEE